MYILVFVYLSLYISHYLFGFKGGTYIYSLPIGRRTFGSGIGMIPFIVNVDDLCFLLTSSHLICLHFAKANTLGSLRLNIEHQPITGISLKKDSIVPCSKIIHISRPNDLQQ